MDKEQIYKLLDDDNISIEEKFNLLQGEYFDTCFKVGYYKEKAKILETVIETLKKLAGENDELI